MRYPFGIQNFEDLRSSNYLYIDKTAYIHRLVTTGKYYFLSRPRRFGKSLLLSTIQAYFEGRKELFAGTAMEHLESEWTTYPVLHLDLNLGKYEREGQLEAILDEALSTWEEQYGVEHKHSDLTLRFQRVIEQVVKTTGRNVVILIDEYDKPVLQTIGNKAMQHELRVTLKSFYGVLKTMDGYIKFAFLTGVTKIGKVSVFSDMNNLEDLSMLPQYNGICGITETELRDNLSDSVGEFATSQQQTIDESFDILREQFDGYHFVPGKEGVYILSHCSTL